MNKHVNYETDLLSYRLRTARQRRRMQYKGFEKKLRTLDRERQALWQKKWKLGWEELKPPVMRGWKRFFVLREDVAASKYAAFFQGILDKINTTALSSRKDFKVRKKRVRKWKYEVNKQQLLEPEEWRFKKMGFTDLEMGFFQEKYVLNNRKQWIKAYQFKEPWRFVLRVHSNMITRTRLRSQLIEQRYAELDNYFKWNHLEPRLFKLKGQSYRQGHWHDESFEKDDFPFKNKSLAQILDKLEEH